MVDIEVKFCLNCGKKLPTTTHARYCSKQCIVEYRKNNMTSHKCMYCGVKVRHIINNNDNVVGYCCKQCSNKVFNKKIHSGSGGLVVKKCIHCNKLYAIGNSNDLITNQRFCSMLCEGNYAIATGYRKTPVEKLQRITKICEHCGKVFKVHPYRCNTSRFCSKKCHYEHGSTFLVCQNCGKTYKEENNILKFNINRQKFCSNCRELNSISAFEIDVYDELVKIYGDNNVQRNQRIQHDGTHYYYPDIILFKKYVIECNGDFYHCNPKFYNHDYINPKTGYKAAYIWEYDNKKINTYKQHSLIPIIIWESDWKSNKQLIIDNIKHEIQ